MNVTFVSKNFFMYQNSSSRKVYDARDFSVLVDEKDISPNIGMPYDDDNTKIKIYEDRVTGWFLNIVDDLKKDKHAGFSILSIATSYIEGNQQFREGTHSEGNSRNYFIKGMRRIFDIGHLPELILRDYYKQIRCGLFHDGMTKENVVISRSFQNPIEYKNGVILINPHKFLDKVKDDFQQYITDLKSDVDLLRNFISRFDLIH